MSRSIICWIAVIQCSIENPHFIGPAAKKPGCAVAVFAQNIITCRMKFEKIPCVLQNGYFGKLLFRLWPFSAHSETRNVGIMRSSRLVTFLSCHTLPIECLLLVWFFVSRRMTCLSYSKVFFWKTTCSIAAME